MPTYKFNDQYQLNRAEYKRLNRQMYKGVQMKALQDGSSTISNPEVFMDNQEVLKEELVKIYYGLALDFNFDTMSVTEFRELYKPIEEIDPLEFKKTKTKMETDPSSNT